MKEKLKISLIGIGHWGSNHLRTLQENISENVSVTIYDQNVRRMSEAVNKYKDISVAKSIQDAIASTDATIIATPSNSHFKIARDAIFAGNDVLIEKPVTQTISGASYLISDKESMGRKGREPIVMVDHILLYNEAVGIIKGIIESGELGPLKYYRADRTHFGWVVPFEDAVNSLMIHDIYMIEHLLGSEMKKVNNVSASMDFDDVSICGKMNSGVEFSLRAAWCDFEKRRTTQITGEKKTLVWDDDKKTITIYPFFIKDGICLRSEEDKQVINVSNKMQPLESAIRHFIECIKERKEPTSGLREGMKAIFTCNGIKEKGAVK